MDRVRGVLTPRNCGNKKIAQKALACRASRCSSANVTHPRPDCLNLLRQPQRSGRQWATSKTRHKTMTQSHCNAVTRDAICTWVARLRPSDRGAIAVITCAGTPTLIPRCGAHGVAFFWRVDPRRAAGSSGRLLREPRRRAPVRPRRADMWTRRADKAHTNKNTQWPPKTSRNGPENFTTARRSDVDIYIFRS